MGIAELPPDEGSTQGVAVGDNRPEALRLEALWRGDFGNQYVERNIQAGAARRQFWDSHLGRFPATRVLEVGCNVGANLQHIVEMVPSHEVWGVDVNDTSVRLLHQQLPSVNAGWGIARELPFRDGWFDLVFTIAVLIHQPENTLPLAMAEMVRCSRRWVCCIEYTAPKTVEVDYRDQRGAFFKRDYGRLFGELFPELRLVHKAELTKAHGFDDGLGYLVFELT